MTQAVDLANAINNFVVGCKQDGIWDPIKACCIMAAWDGLNGALYPLKGAAPTNYNFVSGDYDRETGLAGDGSTKYLDSNRNNNADPQNNNHLSAYINRTTGNTQYFLGARTSGSEIGGKIAALVSGQNNVYLSNNPSTDTANTIPGPTLGASSFFGTARSNPASYVGRAIGISQSITQSSTDPINRNIFVFAVNNSGSPLLPSSCRIAFYSIGESLDLAALDTRVSALITAIGAAIP